jgi:hypothetical protein
MNKWTLVFLVGIVLASHTPVFAQGGKQSAPPWPELSLTLDRLPLGNYLMEVRDKAIIGNMQRSLYNQFTLPSDTNPDAMLKLGGSRQWKLRQVHCSTTKGRIDQSMMYSSGKSFIAYDSTVVFPEDELIAAFSKDSLLNANFKLNADVEFQMDTWYVRVYPKAMVIYMFRSAPFVIKPEDLAINDEPTKGLPYFGVETRSEDYWYYFEELK